MADTEDEWFETKEEMEGRWGEGEDMSGE